MSSRYQKAAYEVWIRRPLLDTTGFDIPREFAVALVEGSAWWHTHSSGQPVRAPRHANRLEQIYCGWAVEFGANRFAAGRALMLARNFAHQEFRDVVAGKKPVQGIAKRVMRSFPRSCVLNFNLDLYEDYPTQGDDMMFGAHSIDVEDCANVLMEITGLSDLYTRIGKIGTDK